jgi:hypothetical protein
MEKRKLNLFSKIRDMDDAQKMTKGSAYGFYTLAALQGGIGFFIAPALLIDAAIIALLAFFLQRFKSRIAAILLFLLSSAMVFSTFQNKFGGGGEGGNNVILALIAFGTGIRAIEATFKYYKCRKFNVQ